MIDQILYDIDKIQYIEQRQELAVIDELLSYHTKLFTFMEYNENKKNDKIFYEEFVMEADGNGFLSKLKDRISAIWEKIISFFKKLLGHEEAMKEKTENLTKEKGLIEKVKEKVGNTNILPIVGGIAGTGVVAYLGYKVINGTLHVVKTDKNGSDQLPEDDQPLSNHDNKDNETLKKIAGNIGENLVLLQIDDNGEIKICGKVLEKMEAYIRYVDLHEKLFNETKANANTDQMIKTDQKKNELFNKYEELKRELDGIIKNNESYDGAFVSLQKYRETKIKYNNALEREKGLNKQNDVNDGDNALNNKSQSVAGDIVKQVNEMDKSVDAAVNGLAEVAEKSENGNKIELKHMNGDSVEVPCDCHFSARTYCQDFAPFCMPTYIKRDSIRWKDVVTERLQYSESLIEMNRLNKNANDYHVLIANYDEEHVMFYFMIPVWWLFFAIGQDGYVHMVNKYVNNKDKDLYLNHQKEVLYFHEFDKAGRSLYIYGGIFVKRSDCYDGTPNLQKCILDICDLYCRFYFKENRTLSREPYKFAAHGTGDFNSLGYKVQFSNPQEDNELYRDYVSIVKNPSLKQDHYTAFMANFQNGIPEVTNKDAFGSYEEFKNAGTNGGKIDFAIENIFKKNFAIRDTLTNDYNTTTKPEARSEK